MSDVEVSAGEWFCYPRTDKWYRFIDTRRAGKLSCRVCEEYKPDIPANKAGELCGAYAECREELGKPEGWLGCSLPKGHEGNHADATR